MKAIKKIKTNFNTLLHPNFDSLEQARKTFFYFVLTFVLFFFLAFSILMATWGYFRIAFYDFLTFNFLLFSNLILLKKNKFTLTVWLTISITSLYLISLIITKLTRFGVVYWITILPASVIFLLGRKKGIIFSTIYYLIILTLFFKDYELVPGKEYFVTFSSSYFILTGITYYFEKIRSLYLAFLKKQKEELKKAHQQEIELHKVQAVLSMNITAKHEIKQPLMILQANLEMLESNSNALPNQRKKYVNNIKKSIERINDILNKLENIEKVEYKEYVENVTMLEL